MGETMKIMVGVPADLLEAADAAVAVGDFQSREHVMLNALEKWKRERVKAIDTLRALIAEGDASGFEPYDGVEDLIANKRAQRGEE